MTLKDRRWKKMSEVFKRAMFLEMSNYQSNHKDCIRQAIKELVPEYELIDLYTLYGVTYDEYVDDMSNAYLRFKSRKISEAWQKAN